MRKSYKLSILLMVLVLAFFSFAGCGSSESDEPKKEEAAAEVTVADTPKDVQAEIDTIKGYAADLSEQLSGEWGDKYNELYLSGEETAWEGYDELVDVLHEYREEIDTYYVYMINPVDATDGDYIITMDGSEEADDWGTLLDYEIQFYEAWEGDVAAARSAWKNDPDSETGDPVWSVFAPVKDSDGNVVGVVGIDHPVPVLVDFPEWNRDTPEWNGLEE